MLVLDNVIELCLSDVKLHFPQAQLLSELLKDKNALHGEDISLRNVILQGKGEKLLSLLVDYDHALTSNRRGTDTVGHRTGTIPFIAIQMLKARTEVLHAYYHDLESLFYVLCWICTVQGGPQGTLRLFEYNDIPMYSWNGDGGSTDDVIEDVSWKKFSIMTNESLFASKITDHFADYFKPVIPCLGKLRRLLFDCQSNKNKTDPRMFSSVLEMLKSVNAPAELVKGIEGKIPLKLRESSDIINSFVEILDRGIAALPLEQRQIPWQGLMDLHPAGNVPSIRVKQIRPFDDKGMYKATPCGNRSKRKATKAPRMDEVILEEVITSSSKLQRTSFQQQPEVNIFHDTFLSE